MDYKYKAEKYKKKYLFLKNNYKYVNFNGLFKINPYNYFEPKNLNELQYYIRSNNKIRIYGSTHVFNDMVLSPDTLINTKYLDSIIDIDLQNKVVHIESGIKLYELLDKLEKNNLTLSCMTATSYVSLGGAIATGAHGSHINYGTFSNIVKEVTMVNHDGQIINISDNNLLKAIRCNIGCLGGIYSIKLKCVDLFDIEETTQKTTWDYFYKNMEKILNEYDYTQVNVDQFDENLETTILLRKKVPRIKGKKNANNILTSKYNEYYIECELAFDYKDANNAMKSICKFHNDYNKYYNFKSDSHILARFCASDDTLLSMASGRRTIFISSFFGKRYDPNDVYKFMYLLCDKMISQYNARPHYGKIHNLSQKKMSKIYKNYNLFKSIKNHFDPVNKFSNDYVAKLFD
jgi:FAD/FMN-containing dehydrogenases